MESPFLERDVPGGLILASRSPRRVDILTGLGIAFVARPAPESVEEDVAHPDPYALPELLARRKCEHVSGGRPDATVLAADTLVILENEILSKPRDAAEARLFLERMSGKTHTVVTGVALARRSADWHAAGSERTQVTFRRLSGAVIDAYVRTGEGRDKAGSYAAQGLGAGLIERIDGCFYNVVGLPVARVLAMLEEVPK